MRRNAGGFTLIEMVIAVAIVVLLAGVLSPIVRNEMDQAMAGKASADLKTVAEAFQRYHLHTGAWPANAASIPVSGYATESLAGFPCLYANTQGLANWGGPYLADGLGEGAARVVAGPCLGAGDGVEPGGLLDPWRSLYAVTYFARFSFMGPSGGIALVARGANGVIDTDAAGIARGEPVGDDLVQVVTRAL